MAQFKCLVSGTVVSFEHEHDIVEMHKHPQYEFVEPKVQAKAPEGLVKEKQVLVKPTAKE
jgi:hypothetical protein